MSSISSPTLIPEVSGRRGETVVALATIALGGSAPLLIDALPLSVALLAGAAFAGLALTAFVRCGWLGRLNRIQGVVWTSDSRWTLIDGANRRFQAELGDSTRVWPQVLWLRWRIERRGASRAMLLTRFDLPADDLRRLVVRLRLDRSGQRTRSVAAI